MLGVFDRQQGGSGKNRSINVHDMPAGVFSKSEVGRTERAATRRNRIYNSQMNVNIRDIERAEKLSMRQIDMLKQELFSEMDSLEARSGWLRDTELASVPGGAVLRKASALSNVSDDELLLTGRSSNYSHYSRRRSVAQDMISNVDNNEEHNEQPENYERAELHPPIDLLVRRHTEIPKTMGDFGNGIRKGAGSRNSVQTEIRHRPSSQVRFRSATIVGDSDLEDEPIREDQVVSPMSTLSISRRSPVGTRKLSSSTLTDSTKRKSLCFIPSNDPRYKILEIPVNQIDAKKVREHARASQKLRIEGKTVFLKKTKAKGESAGAIDIGGQYVPKRVKEMREDRIKMRRVYQESYNQELLDNVLGKFKDLYIVPTGTGLSEAKEYIQSIQ